MHGSTGGGWKRSDWSGSSKRDNPMGNRGHQGFGTYHQMITTAPAPDPTLGLMFAPVEPSGHVVAGDMPQSAVVDGDLGQERSDAGQPGRWTSTGGSRPASRPVGQAAPREVPLLNPSPGQRVPGGGVVRAGSRCEGDDPWSGSRTIRCRPGSPAAGVQVALVADWARRPA